MIPDFEDIIHSRTIESSRIEYKEGWNPSKVAHTICAFANDIDNIGGGYIIIGVGDENGMPKLPITGIDKASIDSINKEIIGIGNLLDPVYIPNTEHVEIDGKDILIIEVLTGQSRPYQCPDVITKDKSKRTGKSYYIRKAASTIVAQQDDRRILFDVSSNVPFDCRANNNAKIADIRPTLIYEYLSKISEKEAEEAMDLPFDTLLNNLKIVSASPHGNRPINAGLLFFNEKPQNFIDGARIEIVDMPDPTGTGMTESVFDGPLDIQLERALDYLHSQVLKVMVIKDPGTPIARRIYNYPLAAIEEVLSNAVYHKDYSVNEPVTVTIRPDRITVLSIPGPDRSISDKDLESFNLSSPRYRNARIGDLLKHRGLAEKRGTGIPTILRSLKENGSRPPILETDSERSFFRVTLIINESFLSQGEKVVSTVTESRRSNGELKTEIRTLLRDRGVMSMKELTETLGYSRNAQNVYRAIRDLVDEGAVEYTLPDKMSSRNQRIRLRI